MLGLMNVEHERYIFFQECITSLNSAWRIVDALDKSDNHNTVAWAAYRMAFIEYAKPYKKSQGIHVKNHTLLLPDINSEDKILHDRIIDLRDTVLAHSDLTVKDAKLYFGNVEGKLFPLIVSNTAVALPSLTEFRGLIEHSLDQLYSELPNLEGQLSRGCIPST
jgi:hypothetical protein